jgi:hypothetical protein
VVPEIDELDPEVFADAEAVDDPGGDALAEATLSGCGGDDLDERRDHTTQYVEMRAGTASRDHDASLCSHRRVQGPATSPSMRSFVVESK